MSKKVAVFDYGSGNIHSALKALQAAGAEAILTDDPVVALEADGLVLPGVGAFSAVMQKLKAKQVDRLVDKRLAAGKPVLGICVGMQVMFSSGDEHGDSAEGLGQWPGVIERLEAPLLPHMGWATLEVDEGSKLFRGIENEMFYFVHSYAAKRWELDIIPPFVPAALSWATHGERFLAAVENGPLSATQFHPEKSGEAGLKLLQNWIKTL
ncbi:imidazole glycerol phosphate synthase subunit HisH [Candidatus Aquiluna sp. UB-MaderosW2red]|uniref:imidazole glycerol phosphate synthase subunit HisH n=1 Tax=Candidatus Aquiluna sp. UB-MaderosW2red TaxID=1855377 RepID=UPI000875BE6D|nr:imidazole glycerol phosphate synthase subunit HisH [Candidatus Aquiluna sp. UB-MaderosW2red]SCX13228.1 glutamine amidotransferase [Candidatus Aquiluna sp. UB-MaderosW2red]